ncbi:MAG: clan AA aspartic protease [Treponema sp.]|nr:clan AA aspartic protease [Treponema sp.]
MGNVFAEITLKNNGDLIKVREGSKNENDVRTITLTALVDTGATTLVINEDICQKLGLSIIDTRTANLAGGIKMECNITEPVQINWKDRKVDINAMVLPGDKILLGVVPLEFMDLMVDPVRQELVGAHGDQNVILCY